MLQFVLEHKVKGTNIVFKANVRNEESEMRNKKILLGWESKFGGH